MRIRHLLAIIAILLLACQAVSVWFATPTQPATALPSSTPVTPTTAPTRLPPSPAPTTTPTTSPTALPPRAKSLPYTVQLHPDGGLYSGDLVSFEIIAPEDEDVSGHSVEVRVRSNQEIVLGKADFGPHGIGGRHKAILLWAWDTQEVEPDRHDLSFTVLPEGETFTETVTLQPASALPLPWRAAKWASAKSECCLLHYITGTAAERDLEQLLETVDRQALLAAEGMQVEFSEPITITLIPRVMGHGGFAGAEVSISYLDRNYAGSSPDLVLHHEMVHILDARLPGELRPSLFVEGLAVYLSGGHFKEEPLLPRAAALLEPELGGLGLYIPLEELADDFYKAQHEVGYLQGAALVEFMVGEWGWEAFSAFYRDIHPHPSGSQARAIDSALQEHLEMSFDDLERLFLETLEGISVTHESREDVRLTVGFYETVRRYQQAIDPSAYFLSAWMPDNQQMRERGIVADYRRSPAASENLALEALLIEADADLQAGRFEEVESGLQAVNAVLEDHEAGRLLSFSAYPLVDEFFEIVSTLQANGYEAQRIQLQDQKAQALVTIAGPELSMVELIRMRDGWTILGAVEEGVEWRRTIQVQVIKGEAGRYQDASQYQQAPTTGQ